jgi:carbamoyl-phosphate synthase small subunit
MEVEIVPKAAYLILENGRVFEGKYFGAEREAIGELIFSTGMTGYLENLTNASHYGQIILQTFPLIGNYGRITPDFESGSVKATAYIVNSWCEEPSNFRNEGNLDAFLKSEGIPGIYGIDTREVTKIIRENGVMNCKIAYAKDNIDFDEIKNYKITQAVESVSCEEIQEFKGENSKCKVVMLDFGAKESIKLKLLESGCDVWLVPYNTGAEQIKNINPDGIILPNGPGNPADNPEIINNIKDIIKLNLPVFGIGLGHQMLALAHGFKTKKLKYGHRGANQPVKNLSDGKVYITSQNHGYTVEPESINKDTAQVLFENVNDKTCEGIEYKDGLMFSAEFYPEAFHDSAQNTSFLFDRFIDGMKK